MLQSWVRVPSAPSILFPLIVYCIIFVVEERTKMETRGRIWPIFIKIAITVERQNILLLSKRFNFAGHRFEGLRTAEGVHRRQSFRHWARKSSQRATTITSSASIKSSAATAATVGNNYKFKPDDLNLIYVCHFSKSFAKIKKSKYVRIFVISFPRKCKKKFVQVFFSSKMKKDNWTFFQDSIFSSKLRNGVVWIVTTNFFYIFAFWLLHWLTIAPIRLDLYFYATSSTIFFIN